ncbi:MAG: type II secretion system F family protein, partial [Thermoguttaceae bacterium]
MMLLAISLDLTDLFPFAVFGMCAALAWWAMNLVAADKSRAVERLDELKNPRSRSSVDAAPQRASERMARVLEKASPTLAKPLQPKNELELGKLRSRLTAAGFRGETAESIFLGLKFGGLMLGLFLGGGTILGLAGVSQKTLMAAVFAAGIFFYVPDIVLGLISRSRKSGIFLGLPDALDLMVVCVEAGLGLDQAMRKVAEEMGKSYPIIAEEFGIANFQLQMGRTRSDVLHELGARTGVSDLRSLAAVLIQADKFGSSVAQALRVQSDSMRTRRRQLAEEKAAKTAVKLIIPLV